MIIAVVLLQFETVPLLLWGRIIQGPLQIQKPFKYRRLLLYFEIKNYKLKVFFLKKYFFLQVKDCENIFKETKIFYIYYIQK